MQEYRLKSAGRIDRSKPLNFSFNGQALQGYAGDTLASALLANGIKVIGRSFKLHRPRGIVAMGVEEPNALVQLGSGAATVPNLRATEIILYEGLQARSPRGWPSLHFDLAAVFDRCSSLLAAGFYYKTFMAPRKLWSVYEHVIRASAGWGKAPDSADPDHYEHINAHCDVLIAGAGPTGLMAALAAARSGARVILADEQSEMGGSLLSTAASAMASIDGQLATDWLEAILAELKGAPNVTLLPRTTVFGYHDHNFLTLSERCNISSDESSLGQSLYRARERLWRVRAKQVVLAQGAIERPLVFCNNDRPGIMLASAVSQCIQRYAVCPGRRAVVFTNNDSAYQTAIDLHQAGAAVAAIVDSRAEGAGAIHAEVERLGITVFRGHIVCDVDGASGLQEVAVAAWSGDRSKTVESSIKIACDLLAMSGGWSPSVHLHSQSGGKNRWNDELQCFVPDVAVQATRSAGAGNGAMDLQDCLLQGSQVGLAAAGDCGFAPIELAAPTTQTSPTHPIQALWRVPATQDADRCPRQFIDFQNDTSVADVRLALREGYRNIEHVKRYTALGFGTDQGKLGNINGMGVVAEILDQPIASIGTTTFRPAYTPVTFGLCAGVGVGQLFDPVRKTALHEWHESAGAEFEVVGQWLRPEYFPQAGETRPQAVARECLAVRSSLAILDASTLGKIRVEGPDAVEFLERLYTHSIANMKVGRCAYGILLGEDGMVKDDGVMARLDETSFYLTTTTGGAAQVLAWMESWLQTEWPELQVFLTSVTEQFSTIAVAGPNSRRLLQQLGCSISLTPEDFPFMTVRDAELAALPVQLFRVSFSGELAFEINIDSRFALHLWQLLMDAGEAWSITPYGTETMHVLRAEKGFFMVGQDTDGSVNPRDLGLHWMVRKDRDYLGKRSLSRADALRADRKQWVGLESLDSKTKVPEGAQLVVDPDVPTPVPMCGHVSSSYISACLDKPIALALVASGRERRGEILFAVSADGLRTAVKIVTPVFYDAHGERQNV
ncbi:MAG: sarcosine oxidase subunit alpha family protein [Xanthomonadales bacterium]|nr:sarcosine oxidase subunit alpha family protein [Xanthomonadales bacterium]